MGVGLGRLANPLPAIGVPHSQGIHLVIWRGSQATGAYLNKDPLKEAAT
jgi:hypothetical protein